jgi:predicted NBD/HSP70 family sugar kinase
VTPTGGLAVGLDIGGTKIRAVAVDGERRIAATTRLATDPNGGAAVLAGAIAAVHGLGVPVASVGVGIPGMVDHAAGTVCHAVNLGLGAERFPFGAGLEDALGVPAAVENDVNAATLGAGLALGLRDLAYLSIGTGLAAGLLIEGRLHRGARGVAGEIGHVPVDCSGELCECGQRGCLELVASGAAIGRRWPVDHGSPARGLFEAAERGVPGALAVRDEVVGQLATAVQLVALSLDPEHLVLGGGVVEAGSPLLVALRRELVRRAERSPLLTELDLPGRLVLLPDSSEAAAVGAAIAGARAGGVR